MSWWRRNGRAAQPAPPPTASARQRQSTLAPTPLSTPEWALLAPLRRSLGPIDLVAPLAPFTARLSTRGDPRFLEALGHTRGPDGPAGEVAVVARSAAADPSVTPPILTPPQTRSAGSAPTVQRTVSFASAAESSTVATPAAPPPDNREPAPSPRLDPVPASAGTLQLPPLPAVPVGPADAVPAGLAESGEPGEPPELRALPESAAPSPDDGTAPSAVQDVVGTLGHKAPGPVSSPEQEPTPATSPEGVAGDVVALLPPAAPATAPPSTTATPGATTSVQRRTPSEAPAAPIVARVVLPPPGTGTTPLLSASPRVPAGLTDASGWGTPTAQGTEQPPGVIAGPLPVNRSVDAPVPTPAVGAEVEQRWDFDKLAEVALGQSSRAAVEPSSTDDDDSRDHGETVPTLGVDVTPSDTVAVQQPSPAPTARDSGPAPLQRLADAGVPAPAAALGVPAPPASHPPRQSRFALPALQAGSQPRSGGPPTTSTPVIDAADRLDPPGPISHSTTPVSMMSRFATDSVTTNSVAAQSPTMDELPRGRYTPTMPIAAPVAPPPSLAHSGADPRTTDLQRTPKPSPRPAGQPTRFTDLPLETSLPLHTELPHPPPAADLPALMARAIHPPIRYNPPNRRAGAEAAVPVSRTADDQAGAPLVGSMWEPGAGFRDSTGAPVDAPALGAVGPAPSQQPSAMPLQQMFLGAIPPDPRAVAPTALDQTAHLPLPAPAAPSPTSVPPTPVQRTAGPTARPTTAEAVAVPTQPAEEGDSAQTWWVPAPGLPASGAVAVQRDPTPPEPVATAPPSPAEPSSAPAGGSGTAAGVDIEDLARRLFDPLSARLRAELWLDRERAGLIADLRR